MFRIEGLPKVNTTCEPVFQMVTLSDVAALSFISDVLIQYPKVAITLVHEYHLTTEFLLELAAVFSHKLFEVLLSKSGKALPGLMVYKYSFREHHFAPGVKQTQREFCVFIIAETKAFIHPSHVQVDFSRGSHAKKIKPV